MPKQIIFITGASWVWKTTLVNSLQKEYQWYNNLSFLYFDSIWIPSFDHMVEEYWSGEEWQRHTTFLWIDKMIHDYDDDQVIIFEWQVNLKFIIEWFAAYQFHNYQILLLDCNEDAMKHRLIYERKQPELVTGDMFNRLAYLRNQAIEYNANTIDTGSVSQEKSIIMFEDYYQIHLAVLDWVFQEIGFPSNIQQIKWKWKVNQVFKIRLWNNDYILRVSKDMPPETFLKERWCIDKASNVGIPSVQDIKVWSTWSYYYMLYNYIEWLDWNDSSLGKSQLWRTLWLYSNKFHWISLKALKENEFDIIWVEVKDYKKLIEYNLSCFWESDPFRILWVLDDDLTKTVESIFLELLHTTYNLWIIHGDLSLKNLIVWNDVISLIDWWSAEISAAPRSDFAEILWCHIEAKDVWYPSEDDIFDYFEWYGLSWDIVNSVLLETAKRTILICFDKLRRSIDRKPDRTERYAQRAKERLNYCLKIIKKLS